MPVQLRLQSAHSYFDDFLDLVRQLALDILLQSSQKERTKDLVQATDNQERLFFIQLDLVPGARAGEWCVEPFIERLDRVEDLRENEVEQGPQLGEVVLKRSTSKDETEAGVIVLAERLSQFTLRVLHAVTLV